MSIIVSSVKWSHKYARMQDSDITIDIDYIKSKYKMSDEDYVRFMIGMQILGVRAYVDRMGGHSDGQKE